ncbi:MAG: hypothetical protein ACYCZF_09995 [Anaerolineae bacterium]
MAVLSIFPVCLWYPPRNTRENWKLVADCGFNIVPFRAPNVTEGLRVLDWLQEFGVKGMVQDPRISTHLPDHPAWQDTVRQVVADYCQHPALWGYFMTDEPRFEGIPNLARLTRAFQAADNYHIAYSNLLPTNGDSTGLGTIDYRTYLRAYIEQVRPAFMSYDYYGMREDGDHPWYLGNLEVMREESLRAGLPFMNIFLTVPHFAYRNPSAEDLRYQVYTSLAYGAKGLTYFTYHTPDIENYHEAVTDIYGNMTEKYPHVRQLNFELQKLGPWLLKLTSTSVYHTGSSPAVCQRHVGADAFSQADGFGCDLLVGEFVDDEQLPWVMVVNKDRQHSAWVKVKLHTAHQQIHEVARSTGELRSIARDAGTRASVGYADGMVVQFWLAPTDGRLMRLSD